MVTREHGEKTLEALLDAAQVTGAYSSLGNYPDAEIGKLVAAASQALGVPPQDVVRWFSRKAIPLLARSYPQFFTPHQHTRDFLLTLNTTIHPVVRKLYPDALVPEFDFETPAPDVLHLGYRSERRMCALAEGFVQGAADHFGEQVLLEQPRCMPRGAASCLIVARFMAKA